MKALQQSFRTSSTVSRLWCIPLLAIPFLASTNQARADLQVCNDTKSLIGVAVGYREKKDWMMEGWWRIPADTCTSVIEGNLASRYYYLHGEEANAGGRWRGPVFMCTSNKQFRIKGIKDCFARGYERTGFFEVDTGDQRNWQVRLTDANRSNKDTESQ